MKLRTSTLAKLVSLCMLVHAGVALAQQNDKKPEQKPEQPPALERIEEGSDVPITVTPPKTGGTRITEKKQGGRVTEAKVKAGPSEYTMKPNVPAGNAQPGDAVSNSIRAPQWTVLEFDLNKKKNADDKAAADAAAGSQSAPPPPKTVEKK